VYVDTRKKGVTGFFPVVSEIGAEIETGVRALRHQGGEAGFLGGGGGVVDREGVLFGQLCEVPYMLRM